MYARVSTKDKQDPKSQIDRIKDRLKEHGVNINDVDIYSEKESGYNDERQQLKRLLDKIEEEPCYYECIYVTEISRIGRKPKQIRAVLDFLEEKKVNVCLAIKGWFTLDKLTKKRDPIGAILIQIIIELADAEAEQLKERSRAGLLTSARSGKVGGGKYLPYGYKKNKLTKMYEIDEEEADTVRYIYQLYRDGYGVKYIAGILNNEGIPTKAKKNFGNDFIDKKKGKKANDVKWADGTVYDIIVNPIYMGKRRYQGKDKSKEMLFLDMPCENIIDPLEWNEIQIKRKSKTTRNNTNSYIYLLKDIIKCGCCGRNYFAKYKPVKGGDKVYICSSRLIKNGNCGNRGVNISLLESAIYNEIISTDSVLRQLNKIDEIKRRLENRQEFLENSIVTNEREREQLFSEQERLLNGYTKGFILDSQFIHKSEELNSKVNNLNQLLTKQKSELLKNKKALIKQTDIKTTADKIKNLKKDRVKLREIYLLIIDKVIINAIDKKTALANVYIKLDGIVLPSTIKLYIDMWSIRGNKKEFRYTSIVDKDGKNLKYNNNVLTTSIEKLEEELFIIKDNCGLIEHDEVSIPEANVLKIS